MERRFKKLLSKTGRFKWTAHNCIGHPFMEIFKIIGLKKLSSYIHDVTMPLD
jgi:hypothetical protein